MKISSVNRFVLTLLAGVAAIGARGQGSFSIRLVADNDFAVFAGTTNGVSDLLYQNNYSWGDQIPNLSTLNFLLPLGDNTFYVLGLGGGGQEDISGTINGVDMTSISVFMSSDLGPYLTGYEGQNQPGGTVEAGTYDANLADVQAAFAYLTWGAPSVSTEDAVIQMAAPNGVGFDFAPSTAHLFAFAATAVGVTPSPEPAALAFAGLGGLTLLVYRRRK